MVPWTKYVSGIVNLVILLDVAPHPFADVQNYVIDSFSSYM